MAASDASQRRPPSGFDESPPAPSPALMAAVQAMKPVRMRSRFTAFAVVLALGLIWPVVTLLVRPLRQDMPGLPRAWIIGGAIVWGAVFVVSLAAALIPRRGDVLPGAGRASRLSFVGMLIVFLLALFFSASVPGMSVSPADRGWTLFDSCVHCIGYVFGVAGVCFVAGVLVLRRLMPVGTRRIGMALGAAGGALGGLALHFICPFAGTDHVVLAHVGGMVLAAAAGAALLPSLVER
ncbi:MAG TPA: NrsF family protein [Polyangia bacterium]|jgi:Negative regulator of sigma F|nr:NrsF family protein [Polyangia bacterium]